MSPVLDIQTRNGSSSIIKPGPRGAAPTTTAPNPPVQTAKYPKNAKGESVEAGRSILSRVVKIDFRVPFPFPVVRMFRGSNGTFSLQP